MLVRKAFQFRLCPTGLQRQAMAQTAGCVRLVWNASLAGVKQTLDAGGRYPGYVPMANKLVEMKNSEEKSFLKLVHSQPLQQTLKDLDQALRAGFKKTKGFPKFKKKTEHKSFRYPQGVKVLDHDIYLPKIGWVKFIKSREIEGLIKNTTVTFDCGHWYVSVQTEFEVPEPQHPAPDHVVGLDVGIASFVSSSEGEQIASLNTFRGHEAKLLKEQRRLSRKKKGSENWQKQKYKVQRVHKKVRDCRKDFLHKTANHFCKNHAVIVLEDLAVSNMSASARGNIENPGRMVKQKAGLNKAILDQGWYQFRQLLTYKQQWLGGTVIAVPPRYTSQTCSCCLHVAAENRQTQALFACISCGYRDHADINAAKNVLAVGRTVLACGDISLVRASAQESPSSGIRVSG